MKTKLKDRKVLITIIVFLLLVLTTLGIILISKPQNEKNNKKEEIKEEINSITETEEEQNNTNEIENNEIEEQPVVEEQIEQENPEENTTTENNTSEKTNTNNNTQKPNNNTTTNNSSSNSSSNSSNNNSTNSNTNSSTGSNNSETTETEDTTDTKPDPVEVTTTNINLNNYSSDIIITKDGTYTLTGTLKYTVYVKGESKVTLNLNGVTIKSKTDSAIANIDTNDLVINLNSGTTNTLSDAVVESAYDGCIFSYGEIIIDGTGTLNVYGNQIDGEGIATKNSPITINNGNINIYAVDDGLNTGGTGGTIEINDGNLYIEAGGDAIDSNQDIIFSGGTALVTGGSTLVNSGLDADEGVVIIGGTIIALGTDQFQQPNNAMQNVICMDLLNKIQKNTLVTILDENDNVIISFESKDSFKNMIVSSNNINTTKFSIYIGGINTGTKKGGIYTGGIYTKGTIFELKGMTQFEIYDVITIY